MHNMNDVKRLKEIAEKVKYTAATELTDEEWNDMWVKRNTLAMQLFGNKWQVKLDMILNGHIDGVTI